MIVNRKCEPLSTSNPLPVCPSDSVLIMRRIHIQRIQPPACTLSELIYARCVPSLECALIPSKMRANYFHFPSGQLWPLVCRLSSSADSPDFPIGKKKPSIKRVIIFRREFGLQSAISLSAVAAGMFHILIRATIFRRIYPW